MGGAKKTPIARYHGRMKRQGFVRVEVRVCREDAGLVRSVAGALSDAAQAAETRALLGRHFATRSRGGLKALLADAPPDGIDLDRPRDLGRPDLL